MRRLTIATLLLFGCFDWDVLSSSVIEPDLSVLEDLSVQSDLAVAPPADLSKADLSMPDLAVPPDLLPTTVSFSKQADAASLGKKVNNSIFGWNATHVTAVGDAGAVASTTNGSNWNLVSLSVDTTQNLRSVWFTSDGMSGWLVGMASTAYQWNGTTWSPKNANITNDLFTVFGTAADKVIAAGNATNAAFRFTGTAWEKHPQSPSFNTDRFGSWGLGTTWELPGASNDCIHLTDAAGAKLNCGQPGGAILRGTWGTAANNIITVGEDGGAGVVSRYNGTAWAKVTIPAPAFAKLHSVWASGPADFWLVGENSTIIRFDGTNFVRVTAMGLAANEFIKDIWGSDANNIWLLTDAGVIYKKN